MYISEGNKECLIAIVSDCPTKSDIIDNRPFSAGLGSILNQKLHLVRIARHECYITHVIKEYVDHEGLIVNNQPSAHLMNSRQELMEELDACKCNVIVALGEAALYSLTGKTQIRKWRGSIFNIGLPSGKQVKVIGTHHPRETIKEYELGTVIGIDFAKAKTESGYPELRTLQRNLIIRPTIEQVYEEIQKAHKSEAFAFDIETSPTNITCISIARSATESISIPTTKHYWGSMSKLHLVLSEIDKLMQSDVIKVAQNISFDVQYLARFFHILPAKPWYDTMVAQHSCYSELPKSLAFLTSVYTNEMYYKDDLRVWQTGSADDDLLWTYNAKDSAVTMEIMEALNKEMQELNVRHTFNYIMELSEPLIFMMLRGVKFDKACSEQHKIDYDKRIEELMAKFKFKFGDVNPNSPKQMAKLAYETLGLKPIMKKGKISCDKKAIEKLALKNNDIAMVSNIRSEKTIAANYLNIDLDPIDDRLRCSFNIGFDSGDGKGKSPETRRLSSSESIFGSGRNLQNLPKKIRDILIPDEGMMFTEADLAGAESRVVAYMCEDPIGIRAFEEGKNIHTYTACMVWNMLPDAVKEDRDRLEAEGRDTETKYFMAKKLRHSVEKVGTWVTISEQLKISAAEAKILIRRFYDMNPNLLRWFKDIELKLAKDRTIVTPFGDKRIFFGRFGPDMVRQAAAHITQEVIGRIINQGIINIYNTLCKNYSDIQILLQVHDSVLLQHKPEHKDIIYEALPKLVKSEVPWKGGTFTIPIEMKSGMNWRDMK